MPGPGGASKIRRTETSRQTVCQLLPTWGGSVAKLAKLDTKADSHRTSVPQLHPYLATVAPKNDGECHRVGGVADQVHLAVRLSRTASLTDLVSEVKTWLKEQVLAFRSSLGDGVPAHGVDPFGSVVLPFSKQAVCFPPLPKQAAWSSSNAKAWLNAAATLQALREASTISMGNPKNFPREIG